MTDTVRIVGAPTDYGASRRGVDMGPSAIRYADLAAALSAIGLDPRDRGNLSVTWVECDDPGRDDAKYLTAIESVCARLADDVSETLAAERRRSSSTTTTPPPSGASSDRPAMPTSAPSSSTTTAT